MCEKYKDDMRKYLLPTLIIGDRELSPGAKVLFLEMSLVRDDDDVCHLQSSRFAGLFNVQIRTITRWKRELEDRGHIEGMRTGPGVAWTKLLSAKKEEQPTCPALRKYMIQHKTLKTDQALCLDKPKHSTTYLKDFNKKKEVGKSARTDKNVLSTKHKEFIQECIVIWNRQEHVTKHVDPNTLILKNARRYIGQLLSGSFSKGKKFNDKYLNMSRVGKETINRKFSKNEIKDTIKRMALYYNPVHLPENKKVLPRTMAGTIYNPATGTSHFLEAFLKPPMRVNDGIGMAEIDIENDPNKMITDIFSHRFGKRLDGHKHKQAKLIGNITKLVKYHESLPCMQHHKISDMIGLPRELCFRYAKWIDSELKSNGGFIDQIEVGHLDPERPMFKQFVKYFEEFYDVDLKKNYPSSMFS